jgi:hypothetical protein
MMRCARREQHVYGLPACHWLVVFDLPISPKDQGVQGTLGDASALFYN